VLRVELYLEIDIKTSGFQDFRTLIPGPVAPGHVLSKNLYYHRVREPHFYNVSVEEQNEKENESEEVES